MTSQKCALCVSRSHNEADKTGQYYSEFNLDGRAISANGKLGKKGKYRMGRGVLVVTDHESPVGIFVNDDLLSFVFITMENI